MFTTAATILMLLNPAGGISSARALPAGTVATDSFATGNSLYVRPRRSPASGLDDPRIDRRRERRWVNFYLLRGPDGRYSWWTTTWATPAQAEANAHADRVACLMMDFKAESALPGVMT